MPVLSSSSSSSYSFIMEVVRRSFHIHTT